MPDKHHPVSLYPGIEFRSPETDAIVKFREALNAKGIVATIRTSRVRISEQLAGCYRQSNKIKPERHNS